MDRNWSKSKQLVFLWAICIFIIYRHSKVNKVFKRLPRDILQCAVTKSVCRRGPFINLRENRKAIFSVLWTRHPFLFEFITDYQMCFFLGIGLIVVRKPSTRPDTHKKLTFATWFFIAPATVWALNRSHALHYVISRTRKCNWFALAKVITSPVSLMRTARVWARLWEKRRFKLKTTVTTRKLLQKLIPSYRMISCSTGSWFHIIFQATWDLNIIS